MEKTNEYIYQMIKTDETGKTERVMCRKTGMESNHYGTEWIEYMDKDGNLYYGR